MPFGFGSASSSGGIASFFRQRQDENRQTLLENDDLNLAPGTQFEAQNDLNRLEVTGANGIQDANRGLANSVSQLEGIANRDGESEAVAKVSKEAELDSDRDEAQFERSTRGFDLSDRQKKAASSKLGLSRALSRAAATGGERRGFTDRSRVASQAGGSFADALLGQRVGAETDIATSFVTDKAAADQRRADKKASRFSIVGTVAGAALSLLSSEAVKDKRGKPKGLLDKLAKVRVDRWNYKGEGTEHIGPYAEEFNDTFGVGADNRGRISIIDALGITMGAVKELNEKVAVHGV